MGKSVDIGERLKLERERIGMSQTALGELAQVGRKTQFNYEIGERFPDAAYLAAVAAAGIDIRYVITGERGYTPPPPLSVDDQRVLHLFKLASPGVRRAALALLATGEMPAPAPTVLRRGEATVTIHGQVGQQIKGDITAPQTFHMGDVVAAPAAPAVKRVRKPRIDR